MDHRVSELLERFDAGRISRRQLLRALGFAAAATVPARLIGQQAPAAGGRAGGAAAAGAGAAAQQAPRFPIPMPFASTGWRTTWLDKLEYECVEPEKAAAFYVALMNWRIRSNDFTRPNGMAPSGATNGKILLDMGRAMGSIEIRGGMTAPPPAAITDAGNGNGAPPKKARFTGYAWGIDRWDPVQVKAALVQRGLNPVEDNSADGTYQSFRVKDPLGFDVAITNGNAANRRSTNASGHLTKPIPFDPMDWETIYVDHISLEVSDFRKSAGFYAALLGWQTPDVAEDADQVSVTMGEGGVVGGAIIRGNAANRAAAAGRAGGAGAGGAPGGATAGRAAAPAPVPSSTAIGHISFGMSPWNTERVRYELIKRGVVYERTPGVREPREDFTGQLQSYHVPDAQGWDLQIGNKIGPRTWG
jgi:catechol 2,3-dioxygenase-like lactoylglutathione lyase family enzyme